MSPHSAPILHPPGLPPGSHPAPPRRVRLWAPACQQSSAPPARLSTAPTAASRRGGWEGGSSPPVGTAWGGGGGCSTGAGGTLPCSPCLPAPGVWGCPPPQARSRALHRGKGSPQKRLPPSPPSPRLGAASRASSVPPFPPRLPRHCPTPPSMFKENFPNGCFYFIACNKGKRPTPLGLALPWEGPDTALNPPQPHRPGQQLAPRTQWAGNRQLPAPLHIPGWEQVE